jgi:hypothetical protein
VAKGSLVLTDFKPAELTKLIAMTVKAVKKSSSTGFVTPGPVGAVAVVGATGATGTVGATGTAGATGTSGVAGVTGAVGATGTAGTTGATGANGSDGSQGVPGPKGDTGATGAAGPAGSSAYAFFYALMPRDNADTVAVGDSVQFPQNGPNSSSIQRGERDGVFSLGNVGTYRVTFSASISEAGQLGITLNSRIVDYSVVGRATGTTQILGDVIVTTQEKDTMLSVVNPEGNSTALTVTPEAGGKSPVSASLVIQQLS